MKELECYSGNDLGAIYTPEYTTFRLWAPTASSAELRLYETGSGATLTAKHQMQKSQGGTWFLKLAGDLKNTYYKYHLIIRNNETITVDPYARAVGVNGIRSMVLDARSTDPECWEEDGYYPLKQPTDAIICEISVCDMTADENSGVVHKGKYLGLTEKNTVSAFGQPSGLSYLKDLGITHVQLMPSCDFGSIDEADTEKAQYNWGYDPVNYNVPEGSYSTDPFHGEVRVKEFKQMVKAFHEAGMGVIMDVVYNHTFCIDDSAFQKTVPDYYYRQAEEKGRKTYSNASGCGNEVASEREMVRKYIVDSVCYWAREYHIDGFRFDLMGVLDLETMRRVEQELHAINPHTLIYGEGWTGGTSVLADEERALKKNMKELPGVGAFSDDIRDALRGHVFTAEDRGFLAGTAGLEECVKFSVCGSSEHPQVARNAGKSSDDCWADSPAQTVNYVSCHDNFTLWDKLAISCPEASREELLAMNKKAAYIVFTSQGIPFFLSGEEFGRTKPVEGEEMPSENSYNLPLETNRIDYRLAYENRDLIAYYKELIAFRKAHPALRIADAEQMRRALHFEEAPAGSVKFTLDFEGDHLEIKY